MAVRGLVASFRHLMIKPKASFITSTPGSSGTLGGFIGTRQWMATATSPKVAIPRTNCGTLLKHLAVPAQLTYSANGPATGLLNVTSQQVEAVRSASLMQMHKTGPIKKKRPNRNPLGDKPFAKGVVLKTLIKKPKKPNSANRRCVLVRLSTGREMLAYIPGEGHNLQEHNLVLVRPGRLQDVPGVKLKCVRGKYDLGHVIKKTRQ
ncbi:30S ribosomal protein S12 technical knockout isoform X2 [Oratosquilla oratoria]|uniref:30S ribosomal protein S12 technical knockout isoform X2 n=1 Tax=Oratosquilla oratoria TaxID=337810 RepID=UPI003F7610E9